MDRWTVNQISSWLLNQTNSFTLAVVISLRRAPRDQPRPDGRVGDYAVTVIVDTPNDATLDERIAEVKAIFEQEAGVPWEGLVIHPSLAA